MTEETQLLQDAAFEIKSLRRQNDLMSARLQMFDAIMLLLHTEPAHQSQGMSPDIVAQIEKYIQGK